MPRLYSPCQYSVASISIVFAHDCAAVIRQLDSDSVFNRGINPFCQGVSGVRFLFSTKVDSPLSEEYTFQPHHQVPGLHDTLDGAAPQSDAAPSSILRSRIDMPIRARILFNRESRGILVAQCRSTNFPFSEPQSLHDSCLQYAPRPRMILQ